MMKKGSVILPGSYDPPTLGHRELIRLAAEKYERVYAVVFINPKKVYTFSASERASMLSLATEGIEGVAVDFSDGFVIDYMREHGIEKIVKGYRNDDDLAWEREQAEYNFSHGGYETELIKLDKRYREISSTAARRAISEGDDLSELLPESVIDYIREKDKKKT